MQETTITIKMHDLRTKRTAKEMANTIYDCISASGNDISVRVVKEPVQPVPVTAFAGLGRRIED